MKTDSIKEYMKSFNGKETDVLSLKIDRFDILGDIVCVDLEELKNFINLNELMLCNLILNNKDLMCIFGLKKLKKLSLVNCELVDDECINILDKICIDELFLDNTYLNFNMITRKYNVLTIKNQNYDYRSKSNSLNVKNANVEFDKININEIETLIISTEQFNNNIEFFKSIIGKIHLIIMRPYDNTIEVEYEKFIY